MNIKLKEALDALRQTLDLSVYDRDTQTVSIEVGLLRPLTELPVLDPICGVCWTSSWQPCPEETPNAVKDDVTGGWMVCGMCVQTEYANMLKTKIEAFEKLHKIESDNPPFAETAAYWKGRYDDMQKEYDHLAGLFVDNVDPGELVRKNEILWKRLDHQVHPENYAK